MRCRFCPQDAVYRDLTDRNLYCEEHAEPFVNERLEKVEEASE